MLQTGKSETALRQITSSILGCLPSLQYSGIGGVLSVALIIDQYRLQRGCFLLLCQRASGRKSVKILHAHTGSARACE